MIPTTMIVAADGRTAATIADHDTLDAVSSTTGALEPTREVRRFGALADHACYRIRTLSGCEAVLSNNALVWPERGGYINVQAAAAQGERIRCLVNGDPTWEPVVSGASDEIRPVVSLVVPGGLLAVGVDASFRIFTTGIVNNAPPSTAR
jgi:hypothetical protein